jgi:chemotaxis protein MotC
MSLFRFAGILVLASVLGNPVLAQSAEDNSNLPLYKMVRSLQNVQDSIARGDQGAVEMQRFMLGEIDKRLRNIAPSDFDDERNVDAAMLYAMSGGNPVTLDLLVSRDARGNFDTRVTNALLMYLTGKGSMATKSLDETVPEYKTTAIGPYLALISANSIMQKSPEKALQYFDWARLVLPGTIVEEAALRRSLLITTKSNDLEKSLVIARRYISRFPQSPYAAQVADQIVALVNSHVGKISDEQIAEVLAGLDVKRRQEVYLRIARVATLSGADELARSSAENAIKLSENSDDTQMKLGKLYLGLSTISTGDIEKAKSAFADVPPEVLGPAEKRLMDAGQYIISEMEKPAFPESLAQGQTSNISSMVNGKDQVAHLGGPSEADSKSTTENSDHGDEGPEAYKTLLTKGRAQLDEIDALIKKGDL